MDKAGRWLRVSTSGQNEASQIPDVDSWCALHGYAVTATYGLHGKSASKGKQDREFARVLDDIRSGTINVLVCWKLDRLDRRGILQSLRMIQDVRDAGGRVEFATESQYNGDDAELNVAFGAHVARLESKTKSDRTKADQARRRSDGHLVGKAAYGYRIVCADPDCQTPTTAETKCRKHPKMMVPDPQTAPVITTIFGMFNAGKSLSEIARNLDANGMPSASGGQWWPKCIATVLSNPVYSGQRRDLITVESIISDEDWLDAQSMLARKGTRKGCPATAAAFLTSVLRCSRCEGPMYRVKSSGRYYYRCWGTSREPSTCKVMMPLDTVDELAVSTVATLMEAGDITTIRMVPGHDWQGEIDKIDVAISQLMPKMRAGKLTTAQMAAETAALLGKRQELESRAPVETRVEEVTTGLKTAAQWRAATPEDRRQWLLATGWQVFAEKTDAGPKVWIEPGEQVPPLVTLDHGV